MEYSSKSYPGNDAGRPDKYSAKKPANHKVRVRRMRGDASQFHAPRARGIIRDDAASDDARGNTVALAAPSDATGTLREACAEVARHPKRGKQSRIPSEKSSPRDHEPGTPIPGGTLELPGYVESFVDEVHRRADLIEIQTMLLNSGDEKIKQRSLERLLEMKYSKGCADVEEPPQIVIDVPRPSRI